MAGEKRIYYRGQGKLFVFTRKLSGGVYVPDEGIWLGNAPEFTLSMSVTKVEHRESYSGQNLVDVTYITEKTATLTATLEEFSAFNLSLCLNGTNKTIASAQSKTVTYTSLLAGKTYVLGGDINIEDFALKDGSSSTVAASKYELDAARGSFTMLDTVSSGGTATYDTEGYELTSLYTKQDEEWWLRFEGINMLDNGAPTVADFYRVKFDPAQNLGFISSEIAQFQITGNPLADETQPASGDLGQFGSIKVVRSAA
jgi:hypothetical protein